MLVSESANKLYNKNKEKYKNMKTKRNYTESLKLSTNEFELFDNTHENIMNFFQAR